MNDAPPPIPVSLPDEEAPRPRMFPRFGFMTHVVACIALLFLVCGAFSNSFSSGMTLDNKYIIEEYYKALIHGDPTLDIHSKNQIKLIFSNDYWWPKGISGLYRPITTFTYWLDYVVFTGKTVKYDLKDGAAIDDKGRKLSTYRPGEVMFDPSKLTWQQYVNAPGTLDTTSYHVINLFVHWLNAVLIYFVALGVGKRLWPAVFVAALFAVHPITTESVTNIIGRADMFAATCVFGGLLIYMRSLQSRGVWRTPWLIGLALIVTFGLFSKESAIAVGAVIVVYWLTFHFDWRKPDWLDHLVTEFFVWWVMLPPLFGMLVARYYVFKYSPPPETPFLDNPIRGIWQVKALGLPNFAVELANKPLLGMSFIECKMTAVKVMGRLLLLLTWPAKLSSDYSYSQIPNFSFTFRQGWDDWQAVLSLIVLLAIAALAVWLFIKGKRAAFFTIAFFFIAALPTSNFTITIGSIMAERFMYLPLAGFTGAVVIGLYALGDYCWKRAKLAGVTTLPAQGAVVGILLAIMTFACASLSYARNPVWTSDLTLWEAAIVDSPKSFRCYQSLAFALFERDAVKNIDRIIHTAESALPLVDKLPNHLNSSRLYLHLGMYYSIKGDTLSVHHSDGSLEVTEDAIKWYEKAVTILNRGVEVDRAFDEVNKAKQRLRGDPPTEITDAGLGPVYATLGVAYMRIGKYQEALNSFEYQRQLDPSDIDAYLKRAQVLLQVKQYDEAAITMLQSILLDGTRPEVWQTLMQYYNSCGERGQGAILVQDGVPKLNIQQPLLRSQICSAYRDFVKIFRRAHRWALADESRHGAVDRYGFPANLFDPLFQEPINVVTPQGISEEVETLNAPPLKLTPATAPAH